MRKRVLSFVVLLAMVVSIFAYMPMNVRAAEELKPVDLIMVLDQSGSMKSNDPAGMMREAASMLVEMMPSNASRVGVISFNRKQTKVAPLTDLSSYSSVTDLVNKVNAIPYKGDTDIGNAVADAMEMFDLSDGREHAILVLSDGRNDFGLDRNAEQKSDERLYNALVEAQSNNCKIYCLGFGKEMSKVDDAPYKKLASIATSPETISTETQPEKIHGFFVKMLQDLFRGTPMEIYDNVVPIKRNVKEANIYMNATEDMSNIDISLVGPDGKDIALQGNNDVRFYKGKFSAVIKLFNPTPGDYTIKTSSDKIKVTLGYIPFYEYILSSGIYDVAGKKVEKIDNGTTAEIQTVIQQDGKDVNDQELYNSVTATATVTAKDTGEAKTVDLKYQNGKLRGSITFDHLATYDIHIEVKADTFNLEDDLQIETNQRAVSFKGGNAEPIGKKIIDKTFKKSATLLVPMSELLAAVEDPDKVGVKVESVSSSDTAKVTATLTDKGIELLGQKWGSSFVTVKYKDGLGNTIQTSFVAKVQDKLLVAFFAALPVLIIAVVILAIYLVMRQSRVVRGKFELRLVEVNLKPIPCNGKTYTAKQFTGSKGTLGVGLARFATESMTSNPELYELFANNQTPMRQAFDTVKFIGTYLGLKGCTLKVKKGNVRVAVDAEKKYGEGCKKLLRTPTRTPIKIWVKEGNTVIHVEFDYDPNVKARPAKGQTPRQQAQTRTRTTTASTGSTNSFFD